jgi:hypothetical protein
MRRERLAARKSGQPPEVSELPRRDGDSEREYQPIERR